MPVLENRLGRFLYFQHLYGFRLTANRSDEGPKFRLPHFFRGKADSISSYCLESGWFVNFADCEQTVKRKAAGVFESLSSWIEVPFRCPACREVHRWTRKDAWVDRRSDGQGSRSTQPGAF
jgi:hypothetical protein